MDILPKEIRGTEGIEPESLDTLLKSFNAETPIPGILVFGKVFFKQIYNHLNFQAN